MTASRSRARGSLLTVQRAGKRRDTAAAGVFRTQFDEKASFINDQDGPR
jgi:hypothetical protein